MEQSVEHPSAHYRAITIGLQWLQVSIDLLGQLSKGMQLAMKALWIGIDGIRLVAEKSRPAWNEAPDKRKTY
jgi:hypothetical protein